MDAGQPRRGFREHKPAISNYASGERGAGFPAPKARVTTASPLWDWAEVSRWLLQQGMVSEAVVQEAEWVKGFNAGVGRWAKVKSYTKKSNDPEFS